MQEEQSEQSEKRREGLSNDLKERDPLSPAELRFLDKLNEVLERERGHMSRRRFAMKVGIDEKTMRDWREKKHFPNELSLRVLRNALGERMDEVINFDWSTMAPSVPKVQVNAQNQQQVPQPSQSASQQQADIINQAKVLQQPDAPTKLHRILRLRHSLWFRIAVIAVLLAVIVGLVRAVTSGPLLLHSPPKTSVPTMVPMQWLQVIYGQLPQRAPTLIDPLTQQDEHVWSVFTDPATAKGIHPTSCIFKEGAYHAIGQAYYPLSLCLEQARIFKNFALQVDMMLLQGSGGGIAYRAGIVQPYDNSRENNVTMGRVRLGLAKGDGSYDVYVQAFGPNLKLQGRLGACPNAASAMSPLEKSDAPASISVAINQGIGVTNKIVLITWGPYVGLFINGEEVAVVCYPTPTSGVVGFFAAPDGQHVTDVAFTNLKEWDL